MSQRGFLANLFLENSSIRISGLSSEALFLAELTLHEVWPALFEIFHRLASNNRFQNDWNPVVSEDHDRTVEKICSAFLLSHFRFCFGKHVVFKIFKE